MYPLKQPGGWVVVMQPDPEENGIFYWKFRLIFWFQFDEQVILVCLTLVLGLGNSGTLFARPIYYNQTLKNVLDFIKHLFCPFLPIILCSYGLYILRDVQMNFKNLRVFPLKC